MGYIPYRLQSPRLEADVGYVDRSIHTTIHMHSAFFSVRSFIIDVPPLTAHLDRTQGIRGSRPRQALLVVTLVMFGCSTASTWLDLKEKCIVIHDLLEGTYHLEDLSEDWYYKDSLDLFKRPVVWGILQGINVSVAAITACVLFLTLHIARVERHNRYVEMLGNLEGPSASKAAILCRASHTTHFNRSGSLYYEPSFPIVSARR